VEVFIICAIWSSASGVDEDSSLLVHYVMATVSGGSKKCLFSDWLTLKKEVLLFS